MFGRNNQRTSSNDNGDGPFIRLRGLKKSYYSAAGEFPVLRGIDLDIEAGEFVSDGRIYNGQVAKAVFSQSSLSAAVFTVPAVESEVTR